MPPVIERQRLNAASRPTRELSTGVVSVGYEGVTAPELIDALIAEGVSWVVDVRLNPISRKPGLSKTKLGLSLQDAGIGYTHLRALGNPKWNRAPFWSENPEPGREGFRRILEGDEQRRELQRIERLSSEHLVALLCFEANLGRCHRAVIMEELLSQAG